MVLAQKQVSETRNERERSDSRVANLGLAESVFWGLSGSRGDGER